MALKIIFLWNGACLVLNANVLTLHPQFVYKYSYVICVSIHPNPVMSQSTINNQRRLIYLLTSYIKLKTTSEKCEAKITTVHDTKQKTRKNTAGGERASMGHTCRGWLGHAMCNVLTKIAESKNKKHRHRISTSTMRFESVSDGCTIL